MPGENVAVLFCGRKSKPVEERHVGRSRMYGEHVASSSSSSVPNASHLQAIGTNE